MASFLPFVEQVNSMQNYYHAHYGSVSAVERGLLASKYHGAGFTDFQSETNNLPWRLDERSWSVNSLTNKSADGDVNYLYGSIERPESSALDYTRVAVFSGDVDINNLDPVYHALGMQVSGQTPEGVRFVKQNNKLYLWVSPSFKPEDALKYPLLEYILNFWSNIGDKHFTIIGKSTADDYSATLQIRKPTKDIINPDFKKTLFPTNTSSW